MAEKCYLCGSTEVTLRSALDRGNVPLMNKVCMSCGLAQRLPMPTQHGVEDYYSEGAFKDENQDGNYPRFFKSQYKFCLAYANALKEYIVNGPYSNLLKVLEIGSHSTVWLFWHDRHLKEHLLSYYSRAAITRLLGRAGLVVEDTYSVGTLISFATPGDEVPSEALGARDGDGRVKESHKMFERQHLAEQLRNPKQVPDAPFVLAAWAWHGRLRLSDGWRSLANDCG